MVEGNPQTSVHINLTPQSLSVFFITTKRHTETPAQVGREILQH